ncbi:MAG: hypothetical protein ING75_11115 [Rhodocyclaceae bacterium]|nr:hypothetical protein [Rhodocyclaceae bacterium]
MAIRSLMPTYRANIFEYRINDAGGEISPTQGAGALMCFRMRLRGGALATAVSPSEYATILWTLMPRSIRAFHTASCPR